MIDLLPRLRPRLGDESREWLTKTLDRVRSSPEALQEVFPDLPRRAGRTLLPAEVLREGEITIDLGALRTCDAAASAILLAARIDDAARVDLFLHGDVEERTMVLRAEQLRPAGVASVLLLGEVQRSNVQILFEALCCDSNFLARAARNPDFAVQGFNRTLLKLAFLNLPLARAFEAEKLANPELSRMLQDLATEREAAGRAVWTDTCRLIARAPAPGSLARIVGALEHGDDGQRKAAAEGVVASGRKDLAGFVRERLPREPRQEIRELLTKALSN